MAVLHRFQGAAGLRWQDVLVREYGPDNSKALDATRQILIGTDEGSENFHLRYFQVAPGGYTSLDQHPHEHGVYVLHGHARVRLGDGQELIGPGDVLFIPGDEVHQFHTEGGEPFGFLCIVPAKR